MVFFRVQMYLRPKRPRPFVPVRLNTVFRCCSSLDSVDFDRTQIRERIHVFKRTAERVRACKTIYYVRGRHSRSEKWHRWRGGKEIFVVFSVPRTTTIRRITFNIILFRRPCITLPVRALYVCECDLSLFGWESASGPQRHRSPPPLSVRF